MKEKQPVLSNDTMTPYRSFVTYLKLFVAMGLTWCLEVLAWMLSSADQPAPAAIIVVMNLLNIFQV